VSVYKNNDGRSPYWHYDFQIRGHRFHGSTKCKTRREAEKVEAAEREKAKALLTQTEHARTSLRFDDVAERYWNEVGQHHARADATEHRLALLIEFFGKDKLLTNITGDDVTKLVAWRRGQRARAVTNFTGGFEIASKNNSGAVRNFTPSPLISPFTVNHTTTQLRKLFTRAKLWGVRFEHEPRWSKHMLPVPVERVRELSDEEADRLDAAVRDDYAPFLAFARASGLRLNECLLRWSEVDWSARQIIKLGKGGKRVTLPITSAIREILWPLRGHHPEMVFTFISEHGERGRTPGQRYPLTYGGVQTYWRRLRKRSGVVGFRFHDYRHDLATKVLRATGNLKLVQRVLNHSDIKSTLRYAHVLDSEVADALERVAQQRKPAARLKVV
jgi:integrase